MEDKIYKIDGSDVEISEKRNGIAVRKEIREQIELIDNAIGSFQNSIDEFKIRKAKLKAILLSLG